MSDEPAVRACVEAVDAWQPIETAPKDQRILSTNRHGVVDIIAWWPCAILHEDLAAPPGSRFTFEGAWDDGERGDDGEDNYTPYHPTVWQPLPAIEAALALPSPVRQGEEQEDMGVAPLRGPGHSAEPEPASAVSSADAASTPNAALDELRSAAAELARRCEIDSCADWPQGVDGSYLDRVRAAIDATYPVIWTEEQVAKLNEYQAGYGHPFTCGSGNRMDAMHAFMRGEDEEDDFGQLIATPQGWSCPACDYRQFWAHDFMFNGALPNPFASVDRSGEADETALAGSAEGESAVGLQAETPDPDFTGHIDCPKDEGGRR